MKMHCALCNKIIFDLSFRPFCSKRCKQIDLLKWLNEDYVITSEDTQLNVEDE